MHKLTEQEAKKIDALAKSQRINRQAVLELYEGLVKSCGAMVQFNHADLGGSGQWMKGGGAMCGDMFNEALCSKVEMLCTELSHMAEKNFSQLHQEEGAAEESWWPADLGLPQSSGSQNEMRYAYFAKPCRLVIADKGNLTIYDTLEHKIDGISQQQSNRPSEISFTSNLGVISLKSLPVISKQKN